MTAVNSAPGPKATRSSGGAMPAESRHVTVQASPEAARSAVFTALRAVLRDYESDFALKLDKPTHCCLETRSPSLNGRRLFFAAAKIKKKYVSYYLPPLYMFPELSDRLSPALKKRIQKPSCFNFTALEQDCVAELAELTRIAFLMLKNKELL